MKLSFLSSMAIGTVVILTIGGIVYAVNGSHSQGTAAGQNSTASSQVSSSDGASSSNDSGQSGQRGQRMQQMLAQLGLTDAQKQQIEQIRQTVTDRRQRREQIMNVLTPEQRAKWQQLRTEHKSGEGGFGHHSDGAPGSAPGTETASAPASKTN